MDPATMGMIQGGLSLGSSLLGGSAAKKAARDQRRLAANSLQIAGTAYSPVGINSPTGVGVSFGGQTGSNTGNLIDGNGNQVIKDLGDGFRQVGRWGTQSDLGNVNLNYGDLLDPRMALGGLFSQGVQGLGLQGLSPLQALGLGLAGQTGQVSADSGLFNSLLGLTGQQTGNAFNQLQDQYQNPFQQGLINSLFQGSQGQFADAARGFGDYRQSTLDTLRQQAQPFEQRAFSNLQDNLFSTGRMGSTGGGLQMEAFARGLGQADLDRQLQAGQEARAAQGQSLAMGTGLAGAGSNIQQLQNQLLQGAFGRFGDISQLASGLSDSRFRQQVGANSANLATGTGLFQLGQNAALNPYTTQAAQINNLGGLFGLLGGIDQNVTNQAELANLFMTNQANTRTGQASIASRSGPAMTAGNQFDANFFSQLAGNLGGAGQLFQGLQGLFSSKPDPFAEIDTAAIAAQRK